MHTRSVRHLRLQLIIVRMAVWCCALFVMALQGCAVNRDSVSISPDADLARLKNIYVVKSVQDERNLDVTLTAQLDKMGYASSNGPASPLPRNVDAVLSYEARWQWDITMYLLDLRVSLRDPTNGALLASATSYHTSLTRKSTEEMVAEVLTQTLRGPKPAPAGGRSGRGNALVQLKPYIAGSGDGGAEVLHRARVGIEPVGDARRDAVGALIGERTTLGGISLGMIEMAPLPTQAVADVLQAELAAAGFDVVAGDAQTRVSGRLTRFGVTTPATILYWDIKGEIEFELGATGRLADRYEARYQATRTDRTFVYPTGELISGVVLACLRSLGARVRRDTALSAFLDVR